MRDGRNAFKSREAFCNAFVRFEIFVFEQRLVDKKPYNPYNPWFKKNYDYEKEFCLGGNPPHPHRRCYGSAHRTHDD